VGWSEALVYLNIDIQLWFRSSTVLSFHLQVKIYSTFTDSQHDSENVIRTCVKTLTERERYIRITAVQIFGRRQLQLRTWWPAACEIELEPCRKSNIWPAGKLYEMETCIITLRVCDSWRYLPNMAGDDADDSTISWRRAGRGRLELMTATRRSRRCSRACVCVCETTRSLLLHISPSCWFWRRIMHTADTPIQHRARPSDCRAAVLLQWCQQSGDLSLPPRSLQPAVRGVRPVHNTRGLLAVRGTWTGHGSRRSSFAAVANNSSDWVHLLRDHPSKTSHN